MDKRNQGFTLLELIIVILLIGILASLALPGFSRSKEDALDKEAKAKLKLIQAAEKIYKLEMTTYYPASGNESAITSINDNLKVYLSTSTNPDWNYTVWNTGCSRATRSGGDNRSWFLSINDTDGEPDSGTGCP